MKTTRIPTSPHTVLVAAIAGLAPLTLAHADTLGSGDTAPIRWGTTTAHVVPIAHQDITEVASFDYLHPQMKASGVQGPMRTDVPAYTGGDSWNPAQRDMQQRLGDLGSDTN